MRKTFFLLSLLFPLAHPGNLLAQPTLNTRVVATGLDTPWEILWGPDDYIWMTERYGRISRVNPVSGEVTPLITINDVYEISESGLMGMALYPDFNEKPWVFVAYAYREGTSIKVRVARYTYSNDQLINDTILLEGIVGNNNHDGSRIIFLPDNTLLVTTGDANIASAPQNNSSLNGKILRMTSTGGIPSDNPIPGSYIWSKGHRNPQGLVWANGKVYSSEHGPNNDDELNIIQKGRNYGWPNVEGFCDKAGELNFCTDSNVVEPITAWTPTLAVAGTDYYGVWGVPEWHNSILITTLKASKLVQIKLNDDGDDVVEENSFFTGTGGYGRLRDLCIAPDGRIFIATSNKDGRGTPRTGDDKIIEISGRSTGINIPSVPAFKLFPNPVTAKVPVYLEAPFIGTLSILDLHGNELLMQQVSARERIEVSLPRTLTPGVYLVRIQSKVDVKEQKMILVP